MVSPPLDSEFGCVTCFGHGKLADMTQTKAWKSACVSPFPPLLLTCLQGHVSVSLLGNGARRPEQNHPSFCQWMCPTSANSQQLSTFWVAPAEIKKLPGLLTNLQVITVLANTNSPAPIKWILQSYKRNNWLWLYVTVKQHYYGNK